MLGKISHSIQPLPAFHAALHLQTSRPEGLHERSLNNYLCGYYSKTVRVLTQGLKVPFRLDGITRVDESYMHVAVREALCNMIIHSDYSHGGVLLAEKFENRFIFTNPGELRVPFDLLREGSVRWSLNPQIEMMFRLIGICDSIGDGYEKMSLAARVRCRVNKKRRLVKFTLEQYA